MNFKAILFLVIIGIIFSTSMVIAYDVNNMEINDDNIDDSEISIPEHHLFHHSKDIHNNNQKNDFTIDTFILNLLKKIF